jgi:DNA-binding XRE family transcriptional regulator
MIPQFKRLRAMAGYYTLRSFAEAVGVSRNTVYLWEKGRARPALPKINRICEILGCEYGDLYKTNNQIENDDTQKQ